MKAEVQGLISEIKTMIQLSQSEDLFVIGLSSGRGNLLLSHNEVSAIIGEYESQRQEIEGLEETIKRLESTFQVEILAHNYTKSELSRIREGKGKESLRVGDWVAYNWLDENGDDNWKVGRVVQTENGLMYFNDDGTDRSGYIPITDGVKLLSNVKSDLDTLIGEKK